MIKKKRGPRLTTEQKGVSRSSLSLSLSLLLSLLQPVRHPPRPRQNVFIPTPTPFVLDRLRCWLQLRRARTRKQVGRGAEGAVSDTAALLVASYTGPAVRVLR